MSVGRALWYSFRYCRTPEGSEDLNRLVVLIASTRLCIITTTVFAVIIGGLVAWLMGSFDPLIFALVLAFDLALGIYLTIKVHIGILILALVGVLSMALYAGFPIDAKRLGLGPILLLIIWGPMIVGGTALALTGRFPWSAMPLSLAYAATRASRALAGLA